MVDFFFQLLQMTKRMAEDVIPDQLLKLDKVKIQELSSTTMETNNSLAVFAKLCDIFAKKDLAELNKKKGQSAESLSAAVKKTSGSNSNDRSSDARSRPVTCGENGPPKQQSVVSKVTLAVPAEELLWKNVIDKIRNRYKQNQKVVDMFYCGFCNVHADCMDVWGSHLGGKKHKEICENTRKDKVLTHFCHACRLFVIAERELADLIINSPEHRRLDTFVGAQCQNEPVDSVAKDKASAPVRSNYQQDGSATKPFGKQIKEVSYQGKVICKQFVDIQCSIKERLSKHAEFTILFCRPCETLRPSWDEWKQHLEQKNHQQKMSNKAFRNVQALCTLCRSGMIASRPIAVAYMLYHVDYCHEFQVEPGHVEDYITIKEVASQPLNRALSSSLSSFKGSCESVGSATHRSRRPTPSGQSTPRDRSYVGRRGSQVQNDPAYTKPDTSGSATDNASDNALASKAAQSSNNSGQSETDGDLSLFVQMLDTKEQKFKSDPSFRPFSALCMLCPQLKITDQFSWFDHIGIHPSGDDQNEVECSECNSFLYGSVQKITEQMIPHPRHCQIDSLMSRL
ncbi:Hypothetical protein NTJ_06394 [Nesidiocoris tenuis]|nr:Hypothetical protein NTJ_06394 [Nesidiocoris tenuis]